MGGTQSVDRAVADQTRYLEASYQDAHGNAANAPSESASSSDTAQLMHQATFSPDTQQTLQNLEKARRQAVAKILPPPKAVRTLLADHQQRKGDPERLAEKCVGWLVTAVTHAHYDRVIKDAARALLREKTFVHNLTRVTNTLMPATSTSFHAFREEMRKFVSGLGAILDSEYSALDLGQRLGGAAINPLTTYHPKYCATTAASMVTVLPFLVDSQLFNYEDLGAMDEMVATHVVVMLGLAVNSLFQTRLTELGAQFGLTVATHRCLNVSSKAFTRTWTKVGGDYCAHPSPRAAYNVDVCRGILAPDTPEALLEVYAEVVNHFGGDAHRGIAKLKNLFDLEPEERAERFHLLSVMVTVVHDTGLTFEQLCQMDGTAALWSEYCTQCPDATQPAERWARTTASGLLLVPQGCCLACCHPRANRFLG